LFKTFLPVFLVLLIAFSVQADVSILNPEGKAAEPGQTLEFHSVMPGEEIVFTLDRLADTGNWSTAWIEDSFLPEGWTAFPIVKEEKSLELRVGIPAGARLGSQNLPIVVLDEGTGLEERFNAVVFVRDDLVSVQLQKAQERVEVNGTACYKATVINSSLAGHKIVVSSSLPAYWFSGLELELKPKDSIDANLCVNALDDGSRHFYFQFDSALYQKRFHSVNAVLEIEPTLKGKYSSPLAGFPFFMPSLAPFYLIDSFLALLS